MKRKLIRFAGTTSTCCSRILCNCASCYKVEIRGIRRDLHITRDGIVPETSLQERPKFCKSFEGNQSLSKLSFQLIRTSSSSSDADWVSELETLFKNDIVGENANKEDGKGLVFHKEFLENVVHDDSAEAAEAAAHPLWVPKTEIDKNAKKGCGLRNVTSPLSKILMEAPENSVNGALNKWVEKGNSLGRGAISMTIFSLRKQQLYRKALQVHNSS